MTAVLPPSAPTTRPWLGIDWRVAGRPALAIAIVAVTYRVSLATLLDSMRLDTPLAHLSLVPLIALGLAWACRNADSGPSIHDRQLDWIVGLFLMSIALAANVLLPARLSTQFWVWRVDLLTLPVFVAGITALLFGTRAVWKYRVAILFLFLSWPYPYNVMLDRWLGDVTNSTIWGLERTLQHVDLAEKAIGSSATFVVMHGETPVQLSVASACSGANGIVGFLLVATAFVLVVDGNRWRKISWLLAGAFLVWMLNIGRILTIFWSAKEWGERVAVDGFHPYVGLVVFNIAVVIMVLTMRVFGLHIRRTALPSDPGTDMRHGPTGGSSGGTPYRPRLASALIAVLLVATGVGVFNGQLRDYDRIANGLGAPRLADFESSQQSPDSWTVRKVDTYTQYERFFGEGSTWDRYQFLYAGPSIVDPAVADPAGDVPALGANIPIYVDVVETPDRAALNAYGIEQCYSFHGYEITGVQSVDLGDGLVGGMLTWTNDANLTWTTLYWHWPISTAEGTRYERVTLLMNDQPTNVFRSPELDTDGARQLQLDLNDVLRGAGSEEDRSRLLETRQFMIGFARDLVALRSPAASSD